MNTSRSLRKFLVRGVLSAALLATSAFAISSEELATLRAKAERGNAVAQYNLGMVYAAANDATSDPIEAYVWLNLAADNGATGRALTLLESQLTPEQLTEGKRRLETRRAEVAAKKAAATPPAPTATPTAEPAASPISSPVSVNTSAASPIAEPAAPVIAAGATSENDVASLQAALSKMSSELSSAWKENDQLKASVAKLSQAPKDNFSEQLAATNNKLKSAEAELTRAIASEAELTQVKQANSHLGDEVKRLTEDNQQLRTQVSSAAANSDARASSEKSLADAQASITKLQAQLAGAETKANANSEANKQSAATQMKLDAALRSYELQQKQLDDLQKTLAAAQAERATVAQQLADFKAAGVRSDATIQSQLKSAQDELANANLQNQQLAKQLADSKTQSTTASPEVATLTAQLGDVRGRLSAAEQALAHAREERERAAKEQEQTASQELTQVRADLQTAQQRATAAEAAASKAAQESDALKQELTAAKSAPTPAPTAPELENVRAQLNSVQQSLATVTAERNAISERLSAAEAKLAATPTFAPTPVPAEPAAASAPTEDVAELHKEISETQSKLDAALRTYQLQQQETDKLQKALANIDAERAQLADRLQSANTQTTQITAQAAVNQDAANQLAATREQLRQLQNQVASLANDNSQLRNRSALPFAASATGSLSAPTRPSSGLATPGTATAPSRPASVATAAAAPTPTPAVRTYTIVDGDTLTRIAHKMYGSGQRWPQILEANRSVIRDVNNLTVGATLKIP